MKTMRCIPPLLSTTLVLLLAASAAAQTQPKLTVSPLPPGIEAKAKQKPKQKPPGKPFGLVLTRHLDQAIGIDAQSAALEAQRRAVASRYAQANSFTPGSPYFGGSRQERVKGNVQGYRESELEIGMPIWLPGEREAYELNVTAGVAEIVERLALRRLDVAALVRDAWWTAQRTAKDAAIARDRLATARDIGNDMKRRVELGENAAQDELLARNETLAAETEVAQTDAAAKAARAAYEVLTDGSTPDGTLEAPLPARPPEDHPALRAPIAALAKAQAQMRLIETGFIDNPEIAIFGRNEQGTEPATEDPIRSNNNTVGVRFRIPLPTPGRNIPRIAEAQAEFDRANAEFGRAQRFVAAEINAARAAVAAARRADGLSAKRLSVASEQFDLARRSFRLGEINAFDLYRVRQLQLDAQRARASAAIDLGVALSRLNQAFGYAPTL
ncbi:outer membrane protein TolC [Methylosinus sp. sav-2]|uniref:TolC family protein n=1 Tax=unclassified Methylosinus TaxID=2624500 RepID=UPI000464FF3A|nr:MULTISPECIES: TolC family protein [unclassified Methylosinus]TDX65555.1 outer membrane protein TolC [Methylosinus sp. sav-2]